MVTQLKNLLVAKLLIFSHQAICQNLDSLGINDNPKLNLQESIFFNERLEQQRQRVEFNFTEKQIAPVSEWHHTTEITGTVRPK